MAKAAGSQMTLEEAAILVARRAGLIGDEDVSAIDPLTIALIIQTIVALLKLWNDCRQKDGDRGQKIRIRCRRRTKRTKGRVTVVVIRAIGAKRYKKLGGEAYVLALLEEASEQREAVLRGLAALPAPSLN